MPFATSLTVLLTVLPCLQAPAGDAKAAVAAVAPVLGEEVAVVAHVDLKAADVPSVVRRLIGKLADEEDVQGVVSIAGAWTDALNKAGARDLFALIDPADMPGLPVVAIPLAAGADARKLTDVLTGRGTRGEIRWPACETIRGVLVAGTAEAVARIRDARPAARPDLADAMASGGDAVVKVAFLPSKTQRRAIEESVARLPDELGGGPVTILSRGVRWGAIGLRFEPNSAIDVVLKSEDASGAEALRKLFAEALGLLADRVRKGRELGALAPAIDRLKPAVQGDRITLEARLDDAAELVSVPVRQAREASRRTRCVNNLKQLGLAMHNYHYAHNAFPAAFSTSKEGKPLLSWRVQILPYLEQKALFDEFHHDEPWDSPHNKTLIARMPETYACPSARRSLAKEGKTSYLTPRGPDTIFPGSRAVKIKEITDGTSNTIMIAEADDAAAVVWTKPDDWEVTPDVTSGHLFGHHPRGSNFGIADGSVRFLREAISPKLLKALVTRNGGEVIGADDY